MRLLTSSTDKIQVQKSMAGTHDFLIKSFLLYRNKHKLAVAKLRGCMSNECWRVITYMQMLRFAGGNISISHQTLMYAGRGMVKVHFLREAIK